MKSISDKMKNRNWYWLVGVVLIGALIIFVQNFLMFRMSDSHAKADFAISGVDLQTETFDSNGFSLHFVKTGNDTLPTLFFVHGSPGSWNAFSAYLKDPDLLEKYRMVSIDRPGFGFSQFGQAKNLSEQASIIKPLLYYLSNGQAIHIIGHSLGGPLTIKLVADNPSVFNSMVLLAPSVDPTEEPQEKWRGFLYRTPFQYLMPGALRPSNNELWMAKEELVPLAADFANITCHAHIIHGDNDGFVPVNNAYYAQKMLVNAQSVQTNILPGGSHFIVWGTYYPTIKAALLGLGSE